MNLNSEDVKSDISNDGKTIEVRGQFDNFLADTLS
jgi:hypothetical protein